MEHSILYIILGTFAINFFICLKVVICRWNIIREHIKKEKAFRKWVEERNKQ